MSKKPELLAPAGNWVMLRAAAEHGADAIYLGADKLNMRAKAKNFGLDELGDITDFLKNKNIDTHLTINTIVYENELQQIDEILGKAKETNVDMIICWDPAVIQKCVEYELPFCISTQASISNTSSAMFYKNLGAKRIVLARECTLEQIIEIKEKTRLEIETFVHGAMCVAVSGRCFLSHEAFARSANKGDCIQPCRREFKIIDKSGEAEYEIGEDYVLSPKDLNTIYFIDKLIDAGIDSFKIEGRKRSPEYISKVISTYRKAIDLHLEGKLTKELKEQFNDDLGRVYNRGFSDGFYFGQPGKEQYAGMYGSLATTRKEYCGKVINYFKKSGVAHIKLEASSIKKDDEFYIIGKATGIVEFKIDSLFVYDEPADLAEKGSEITIPVTGDIRNNDKLYKIVHLNKE